MPPKKGKSAVSQKNTLLSFWRNATARESSAKECISDDPAHAATQCIERAGGSGTQDHGDAGCRMVHVTFCWCM